jgi:hypothetical protein
MDRSRRTRELRQSLFKAGVVGRCRRVCLRGWGLRRRCGVLAGEARQARRDPWRKR